MEGGVKGGSDAWRSAGFFASWEAEAHIDVVV